MKNEKGQGTEQVKATAETGSANVEQAETVATAAPAIRDLQAEQAEKEADHDHEAAKPILAAFTTNILSIKGLKEASDGRKLVKETTAALNEHIDAAIVALEGAQISGPRLSRIMAAEFAPVLEKAGWASAKDAIQRRCTKFGHRQRAPKAGEQERKELAAIVKEQTAALKAMNAGSVADQVARFQVYWNAATEEQKAAIRAVVNADELVTA